MRMTTKGSSGRFLRRIVLGSVMLVAATAWMVLGDNGERDGDADAGAVDDGDLASPCQRWILVPVLTNGVLVITNGVPANMPDGSNGAPFMPGGSNGVAFFKPVPVATTNPPCLLNSCWSNKNVAVKFQATWCCKPGQDCAVLYRGQWMALTNFEQQHVTGCISKTGCR